MLKNFLGLKKPVFRSKKSKKKAVFGLKTGGRGKESQKMIDTIVFLSE